MYLIPEAEVIHHAGTGQSEGERHPDARNAPSEGEAEDISQRQGDDEIGDEREEHHRAHVGYSAERIGEIDLKPVAKLVEQERDNYLGNHHADRGIVGKPASDVVPQKVDGDRGADNHHQDDVESGVGYPPDIAEIPLPEEIADAHGYGGSHAVVHHETYLGYGYHDLVGGKFGTAQPAHHDGTEAE